MRLLILVVLIVGMGAVSCKEYELKQPAYLNFKWDFSNQASGSQQAVVTSGYFYLKKVTVTGTREEGPGVDIEQDLPVMKTVFSSNGKLGLSIDVPVGDYTQFNVALKVVDEESPCMALTGTYTFSSGESIPFRIEWVDGLDLTFMSGNNFTLDKKKSYNAVIGADVQKLFSATIPSDWTDASPTLENGQQMLVISQTSNSKIFGDVNGKIAESLLFKIE